MAVGDHRYLIIGGTTKAGTTSVYNYLSAHPQVSASYRKEVNYFLDPEFEGPSIHRYEDGVETYAANFDLTDNHKLYLEASPGYLYSPGTPSKIKHALPNAKLIFILREPYSRLLSWYKFAQQTGLIRDISISDFINEQLRTLGGDFPNYMEQGIYSRFLENYYHVLGTDRIKVVFFEELKQEPKSLMTDICTFADIAPEFFDNYKFAISNKSFNMRSVKIHESYIAIRQQLSLRMPSSYYALRKMWQYLKPFYIRLNSTKDQEIIVPDAIKKETLDYYANESKTLEKLLGRKIPWHLAP